MESWHCLASGGAGWACSSQNGLCKSILLRHGTSVGDYSRLHDRTIDDFDGSCWIFIGFNGEKYSDNHDQMLFGAISVLQHWAMMTNEEIVEVMPTLHIQQNELCCANKQNFIQDMLLNILQSKIFLIDSAVIFCFFHALRGEKFCGSCPDSTYRLNILNISQTKII